MAYISQLKVNNTTYDIKAATSAKLTTARTISLTGSITGSGTFDGSDNLSIATTTNHNHNTLLLATGNLNATGDTRKFSDVGPLSLRWYSSSVFTNQPSQYGFCLTMATGSSSQEMHQLWFMQNNGAIYHRGTNGSDYTSDKQFTKLWQVGDSVTGAVWNDYAEYRESDTNDFGYVLAEKGDDTLTKTTERLQHFAGVSSNTWGFAQGETDKAKTPIAVAGRVLVYTYRDRNEYKPGDCVCAAPGGTVDIMSREEIIQWPDRIVGTVSCVPNYEEWGGGEGADRKPVKVDGRIWIKVK